MAMPSGSELLLIFGVVVLLFGSKKIPELAKGIGQGIRNFKNEMKEDNTAHPPSQSHPEPQKTVEPVMVTQGTAQVHETAQTASAVHTQPENQKV